MSGCVMTNHEEAWAVWPSEFNFGAVQISVYLEC